MSLFLPFTDVTHRYTGSGGGRARGPRRSAAPDRRPLPVFFTERAWRARLVESSTDLKETRVVLIAPARSTATLRPTTQLLVADEGKCGTEMFLLNDRGLRDLAIFIEGPIRRFDATVSDCQ